MWYLQVDTLIRILLASVLFAVFAALMRKFCPVKKYMPYLLILDLALLFYVSWQLAVFYIVYTLVTYGLSYVLTHIKTERKLLFPIFCLLCAAPFLYTRTAGWFGLPTLLVLVGFAYNMLKAIDVMYYTCYTEIEVPFVTYANYLLFFPVFTAGPIFRFRDFNKFYNKPLPLTAETVENSVKRFILGMFKKMVVVALLAILLERFLQSSGHWYMSLGIIFISYMTLYFDLSGYSDIAIAVGSITGIPVPENFKKPFTSPSFTQFWRNWHVTLSDFIREHIFVVLRGKKLSKYSSAVIGMSVMVIMSLWHEFSIASLLGGIYMGMFLVIENIFSLTTVDKRKSKKSYFYFRCFLVNFFFALNALFFTLDIPQMMQILKNLFKA